MFVFPTLIECGDFCLAKIAPTDENAQKLFSVVDTNRDFLGEFLEWVDNFDLARAAQNVEKTAAADKLSYFILSGDQIIGKIGFTEIDDNSGELSYWLAHSFNGRGIMSRALREVECLAFETVGLARVQMTVDARNIRSCALLLRAGYTEEGLLRKYFLLRGELRDMKMFSKLKSEWKKGGV